jgi:hypothetical protein
VATLIAAQETWYNRLFNSRFLLQSSLNPHVTKRSTCDTHMLDPLDGSLFWEGKELESDFIIFVTIIVYLYSTQKHNCKHSPAFSSGREDVFATCVHCTSVKQMTLVGFQ